MDSGILLDVDDATRGVAAPAAGVGVEGRMVQASSGRDVVSSLLPVGARTRVRRPVSELFLPTPAELGKKFTNSKLGEEGEEDDVFQDCETPVEFGTSTTVSSMYELSLPTSTSTTTGMGGVATQEAVEEEETEDVEVNEMRDPPLSPISSAMSKARFSKLDVHSSLRRVLQNVNVITEYPAPFHERTILSSPNPPLIERAMTAPLELRRQLSSATVRSTRSMSLRLSGVRAGGSSSREAGVRPLTSPFRKRATTTRFSGIDKDMTAAKRQSALLKRQVEIGPAAAAAINAPKSPGLPVQKQSPTSVLPWRRKRRGETMSMLLESGFFPVEEYIYKDEKEKEKEKSPTPVRRSRTKKKSLALDVSVRNISSGPTSSIIGTPTEFYHRGLPPPSPRRHIRGSFRRSQLTPRRRALGIMSGGDVQRQMIIANALALSPLDSPNSPSTPTSALSTLTGGRFSSHISTPEVSPGILEVIPEDGNNVEGVDSYPVILEEDETDEPKNIDPDVPIKTEIHLMSGTVLTVTPPELTCWMKTIYIQGPIKLPTPAIAPRRDSIASLAPFQGAVDKIYTEALQGVRRASEDTAMDDLLDWYEDWSFAYPSFDPDSFRENIDFGIVGTDSALDEDDDSPNPLEKEIATRMLSGMKSGHLSSKALAKIGLTADDIEIWFAPTSSTKPRFSISTGRKSSMVSGRKRSAGGSASFRKGSGYALDTLDENSASAPPPQSTQPAPSPPISKVVKSIVKVAKKGKVSRAPISDSKQGLEWGDDDDESTGFWGSHVEVREITRLRKPSDQAPVEMDEAAKLSETPKSEEQGNRETTVSFETVQTSATTTDNGVPETSKSADSVPAISTATPSEPSEAAGLKARTKSSDQLPKESKMSKFTALALSPWTAKPVMRTPLTPTTPALSPAMSTTGSFASDETATGDAAAVRGALPGRAVDRVQVFF